MKIDKQAFREGFRDGIPIGLGYLAVSFSLGITARECGLNWFQGFLASATTYASAGEYAAFTLMAANATYLELAIMMLIANGRYLLMSCALSQKFSPEMPFYHRPIIAINVTDELFGINIARKGYLNPSYTYAAVLASGPLWAIGTAIGVVAGNILPVRVVSALSVALFGMFIAIIIPPIRKQALIGVLVAISFLLSFGAKYCPGIKELSEGTRTIILTVLIAGIAAALFPVPDEEVALDEA